MNIAATNTLNFGDTVDLDSCEILLQTRWPDKERGKEMALFAHKAFDMRVLHPVHATYLIGHLFTQETRRLIRTHVDDRPARVASNGAIIDWEPIKAGDIMAPPADSKRVMYWRRKIISLIRARQSADEWGIPYEFYVRTALHSIYFGRFYILERTKLPEPGLLNGAQTIDKVRAAWVDEIQARIQCARHPRYLIANDSGHPDVAAHQTWLMDQIARKSDPVPALRKFIGSGHLRPELAAARFGAERVARATF